MTQTPPPPGVFQQPAYGPAPVPAPASAEGKLSALAVCALVASGIALVPVGVVLGIVALFRTQRLRQRGKRLAVVALSLCAAWTALGMAAIITGAAVVASHTGDVDAFAPGTCFDYHDGVDVTEGVDVLSCGNPHDGEVVAHQGLGSSYPGEDAAARESVVGCIGDAARAIPDADAPDPAVTRVKVYYPSPDAWDAGMRSATCVLTHVDHSPMTGDALDGSSLTPQQRQVLQTTNETVLLRLKLLDVPASGWKIAAALEQRLATADQAESAALAALAADPPAGTTSDLPVSLHDLSAADTTEAAQARSVAAGIIGESSWQSRIDAGDQPYLDTTSAYKDLRSSLGVPAPGALG
ncbi:hypothetical protein ABH931_005353 [Streptacidiphilus sp. MAP12-33]|uniref:DUF4190 domain-containing protein n=1 Tax=Streptacidiphilus sp. MAP12-33 TaxID=3156266 RepID=UPI003514FFD1